MLAHLLRRHVLHKHVQSLFLCWSVPTWPCVVTCMLTNPGGLPIPCQESRVERMLAHVLCTHILLRTCSHMCVYMCTSQMYIHRVVLWNPRQESEKTYVRFVCLSACSRRLLCSAVCLVLGLVRSFALSFVCVSVCFHVFLHAGPSRLLCDAVCRFLCLSVCLFVVLPAGSHHAVCLVGLCLFMC
jgi:hypothetical protein